MPNTLEKHKVRDTVVRIKRLGECRIEIITSDRKKELQMKLFKSIRNVDYTSQVEHTKLGNLTCRLESSKEMSFNQLVEKIVNLIAPKIERYEKRMSSTEPSTHGQKKKGAKGYRNRPALATT